MTKQPKKGFLNETGLQFEDISAETTREYTFPTGRKLVIEKPKMLNVSASGGHRVYADDGYSYYVQPREGWSIRWKSKTGNPNFVK
jgi:hypothetical protein